MKKNYETPLVDVFAITCEDIIMNSPINKEEGGEEEE